MLWKWAYAKMHHCTQTNIAYMPPANYLYFFVPAACSRRPRSRWTTQWINSSILLCARANVPPLVCVRDVYFLLYDDDILLLPFTIYTSSLYATARKTPRRYICKTHKIHIYISHVVNIFGKFILMEKYFIKSLPIKIIIKCLSTKLFDGVMSYVRIYSRGIYWYFCIMVAAAVARFSRAIYSERFLHISKM